MKTLFISFLLFASGSINTHWLTEMDQAKKNASAENKNILLYFSGSDWCKPCIQLRTYVLDSEEFGDFIKEKFVLVQADFPRLKKNKLSREQEKHNEMLAEKYNPKGIFPLLVVLNPVGEVLKKIEYRHQDTDTFMELLNEENLQN